MNHRILSPEVQEYLDSHADADAARIGLGKSPFPGITSGELARQIDSRSRSKTKLPSWYHTSGIYYPPKISIEQSSSELTAKYKARLLKGNSVLDLTGGFGVDTFFFSQKAAQTIHCERNEELSDISRHNSERLGANITYVKSDGIGYLQNADQHFDTIYADPSRRSAGGRVFLLKDCEPDVIAHKTLLINASSRFIVKTSPLLDIQSVVSELVYVDEVHILSIKNDCKEVVYVVNAGSICTDPVIHCVILPEETGISFRWSEERAIIPPDYSPVRAFLYEPDAAVMKGAAFKIISNKFSLGKIHRHTHLYTSNDVKASFPGRIFGVKQSWSYGDFLKQEKILQANIICRNFPLTPEALKKKLKIKDGGEDYLVFFRGINDELMVVNGRRIK